ncbi:universal stress protein UspA [Actinoplanes sp. ATCC 53533]|uniref:universal stress protein n=1 Tax=Actinoplanes sp. ATCC 53533 TaxID=1288362 RepID=UPI000F77CF45|nr:universal stress protein [Actinoplanes sp. ATCC 53533]RSM49344.1 universal stress protein UspA [Actinoplanes sp. ATCC 53533]
MTAVAGAPVVVGVDGSRRSLDAVETAAAEAALRHRPLRIVHAFGWPSLGTPVTPGLAGPSLRAFRDQADEIAHEASLLAAKVAPDTSITAQVLDGGPGYVLRDESRQAALLVLGDRGLGGFSELLIGSVAVQTATHGACPVLVVRGERRSAGPIVVGVDGSAASVRALDFAVEEAALRGTELLALHVWTSSSSTELNDTLPISAEAWSGDQEENRVLAEALAGIAQRHPDVPIRREVVRGSARRLLVERSRTAQLVVVGKRASVARLLLGSVSQHLIHHAACPTAVVRPAPNGASSGGGP